MGSKERVETRESLDLLEPRLFRVIMWNDDYTTMDFVVEVLTEIFHKNHSESVAIMIDIHKKGKGVCGTYVYEIAETKRDQAIKMARSQEFPLRVTLEECE